MDIFLSDIFIETFRAVVAGAILIYLFFQGKKNNLQKQQGWHYILAGFGLLFFGTLIDITDNFPELNQYIIIGDTETEALLEKVAGYTLGTLLLAVGFYKWLPAVLGLREAKEKLTESEDKFKSIFDNASDAILIADTETWNLFSGNQAACRMLGYSPEELSGLEIHNIHPEEDLPSVIEKFEKQVKGEITLASDVPIKRKDGSVFYVDTNSFFITIGGKRYLAGVFRDITKRKGVEKQLKESENRFRGAFENITFGAVIIDLKGKFLKVNNALCRLLGYTEEELQSKTFSDITHPEDVQIGLDALKKQLAGISDFVALEKRYIRKDGGIINVLISPALIRDSNGDPQYCVALFHDITGQKLAETALKELVFKYRIVANNTSNWEFWLDPEGRFIYTSPSCERITGHTGEKFMSDHTLLHNIIHAEDRLSFDKHHYKALNGQKPGTMEFRVIRPDGTICWIDHVCQPVFSEDKVFLGTRGSNRDITERKMMEEELLKSRNLESLGLLAGGIAHDFNNLLQGILGNITMAKINTPQTSKAFGFLDSAEDLYSIAGGLTNQLLAFATGGISIMETIQPGKFIRDAVSFSLSGSNIKAVFDLPEDLLSINADVGQLQQVLNCIVFNARDAMPSGGIIQVTAKNEPVLHGDKNHFIGPGEYVKISIKDHGAGISKENLSRIFDPYFSTKERGPKKGMGLGLAICDTIIKKHGGMIKVESGTGVGTTVHLYLPADISETGDMALEPASGKVETRHGARILIMDDEPAVFEVAINFLEFSGYRVDLSVNGEEAVKAYKDAKETGDPYAAVILDLTIPGGMGGKEVVSILRGINPEVKAIVSSGYAHDPVFTDYASYGFAAGLAKPYRLKALKEIIESVLAR